MTTTEQGDEARQRRLRAALEDLASAEDDYWRDKPAALRYATEMLAEARRELHVKREHQCEPPNPHPTYDDEFGDNRVVEARWRCPDCGQRWRWKRIEGWWSRYNRVRNESTLIAAAVALTAVNVATTVVQLTGGLPRLR